jgi:hypothetical protein
VAAIFSIAIYTSVSVPALRTIVDPVIDVDTREDQIEALRLLSAGNVLIIGLLVLILTFQAGQSWALREFAKELSQAEAESKKTEPAAESKKDQ